ncbi:MAG TPA: hypothetical protein VFV99_04955, partial [Kofleriaceae bacterium]|nr:hypothetical protein [Kofleriaceae bacterium]
MLLALVACGDDQQRAATHVDSPVRGSGGADLAAGMKTELDGDAPAFGDGVLAELTGDDVAARAS